MERFLPLYEAKMLHLYDDQWATYEPNGAGGYTSRLVTREEKNDRGFHVMPRYWVAEHEVEHRLGDWKEPWLLGWRDICRSTDERTLIAAMFNKAGVGNKIPLALGAMDAERGAQLAALLSSFACDFVARQKVGGTTLNFFLIKQFPVPAPIDVSRNVELRALAHAASAGGRERYRFEAAVFRAFGLRRPDVAHVLDSFRILRRRELTEHGVFQTKLRILEAYDELGEIESAPTAL